MKLYTNHTCFKFKCSYHLHALHKMSVSVIMNILNITKHKIITCMSLVLSALWQLRLISTVQAKK